MAKIPMKRIEIVAMLSDSQKLIDYLQRRGTVEITNCEEREQLYKYSTNASVSQFEKFIDTASEAKRILNEYAPHKKSMLDGFKPRHEITAAEYIEKSDEADKLLNKCYEINRTVREINEKKAQIVRNTNQMQSLVSWLKLDIPLKNRVTKSTALLIGTLPYSTGAAEVLDLLNQEVPDAYADGIEIEIVSTTKELTCMLALCGKNHAPDVENTLRAHGFVRPAEQTNNPPRERYERYVKSNEQITAEINELEKSIAAMADLHDEIDFVIDYFTIRRDKYEALSLISMGNNVLVLTGFVPEPQADDIAKQLESDFTAAVLLSDPLEDEAVPVLLKNNSFAYPVEPVTEMYSMPAKSDIDPNAAMSFFYYMFFGMMFSDAGYGLLMVLATAFVMLKLKPEREKKKMVKMYFFCGISTMFWGVMYGSFFGDLINIIRTQFLDLDAIRLYVWLDPAGEDLMTTMMWCFLFGIIHLFVGVALKGYLTWKEGDKWGAVADVSSIYLAVGGAAPLCAGMIINVPQAVKDVAKYAALIGVVLIITTAGRASKNIFGKLGSGLYALYNTVAGYFGDILSYSRLLALGLVTGIVGNMINMLGTMPQNKMVKVLLLLVVFPLGHGINFAINVIGAYVHTNRLQYVEFFSRFYEGGDKKFQPLKANTKTFKFKEEITNG